MRAFLTPVLAWVLVFTLAWRAVGGLSVPVSPGASPPPKDSTDEQIEAIIDSLTPEERVGQLVLVTFEGSHVGADTVIAQLVHDYNLGGVVVLAENDNINGYVNIPRLVQSLTGDLQRLALDSAEATEDRPKPRAFVPLFIATTHLGNNLPGTQIGGGTTPLPSQMALGATWNPQYAQDVGRIAGTELEAMGINMLLGPALDVSQQPQAESKLDLGVDTFGGEPYWVGKMGQAYVTGVHEGSQGRMAVIAQNFPGLGLADTQPKQQIPVVPRSLEDLREFDLIPYAAVTDGAALPLAAVDGMQCANIRYLGEDVRSITRPVCVDELAAGQLLALDEFDDWRKEGIMISSPLGTHAMRRYYNITPFPHRQVAREAFLAGNDMLYLSDFGPNSGDEQRDNVVDTIQFFAERYEDDPVFRARVDVSLRRVLRLKLRLYNNDFAPENVLIAANSIDSLGGGSALLYNVAQESTTLLAPRRESLPPPPVREDNIVIFTDVRLVQQCSYCATYPLVSVNALEVAIERMYGPLAGAQIRPERVLSFSFNQLQTYLQADVADLSAESSQFKTNQRIGEALVHANWLVFVMLDVSPEVETSTLVRHLLDTESAILEETRVVVIALGAPTYLSSTEISRFAAYYGLYSTIPPYIDAAARALFQETTFSGAPPISVPAVGYDVLAMTAPDPMQTIYLEAETPGGETLLTGSTEPLTIGTGERIDLLTRPILDRNGHIVPDNTPVEFTVTFVTDNLQTHQFSATQDGIARTGFRPTRPGRIQIVASSAGTARSATFQVIVQDGGAVSESAADQLTAVPTGPASLTPEAAALVPDSPGSESVSSPGGNPVRPSSDAGENQRRLEALDLVLALFGLVLLSTGGFWAGRSASRAMDGGVRVLLGCVVAGLTGYIYYGLGGPGTRELYNQIDNLAPLLTTLVSGLIGLVYTWWLLRHES